MVKDIEKVVEKLVELSTKGGTGGSYDNNVVNLNFKIDERFDLDVKGDTYELSYMTEVNSSPTMIRFKKTDVKEAIYYPIGEFERCVYIEVIQIFFNDGSQLDFWEDYM